MPTETSDVLNAAGAKTATRVTFIDDYSKRYSADIPVGQDTAVAIAALADQLAGIAAGTVAAADVPDNQ